MVQELVVCEQCRAMGVKSTVRESAGKSTAAMSQAFFDEEGRRHHHDPNKHSLSYTCSNGHSWVTDNYRPCWCGWMGGPGLARL